MRGLILLFVLWAGGCAASHPVGIRCERHLTPINAASAPATHSRPPAMAVSAGAAP